MRRKKTCNSDVAWAPRPCIFTKHGRGARATVDWFTSFSLLLLITSLSFATNDSSPTDRLPVPNSAAQAKIVKEIRERYHDDYAKRTAADQLALAQQFRAEASIAGDDSVRRYVLLREARELATNSGDLKAAFGIIDDTIKLFALDGADLKVTVMSNAVDRALIPKVDLMDQYLKICNDALDFGDLTLATHANMLATRIARGTRNPDVIARAHVTDLRMHDARREVTLVYAANERRKANPEDGEANLIVGRYMCFVQDHWEGLTFLAVGSDKQLRGLAEKDIAGPPNPTLMADLGDAWWDLPDSKQTPQSRSRGRAAHWYELALPGLSGDRKKLAEKRIAEVKQSLSK
jgi:hypothetical protein